ncbi:MAG: hypothetical protein GX155_03160 [Smithella sp.]|nr:hypothetical protein [Smithella sp.]
MMKKAILMIVFGAVLSTCGLFLVPLVQASAELETFLNQPSSPAVLDMSKALALQSVGGTSSSGSSSGVKVQSVTGVVKSYDGKTLLLTSGERYSLAGVNVIDLTKMKKFPAHDKKKGRSRRLGVRITDMTFVDGRLTEVVFRLR